VAGLTKVLPGDRVIFKDVSVSFLGGAKIGVVGPNGAGKSTLLRVLSGADRDFDGDIWRRDGLRIGHLAQEPELDPTKNVHDNIMDGLKHKTDLLARFEEISAQMADPDADMTAVSTAWSVVRRACLPAGPLPAERARPPPPASCHGRPRPLPASHARS